MGFSFRKSDGSQKTSVTVNAPAGAVMDYAGTTAPDGWLLCDGSVVSQATYSNLYAIIGSTYNTGGEGAGNFRLPDCRGKVSVHPDSGAGLVSSNNTLAATSGAEDHQLTTAELATHSHANTLSTDSAGAITQGTVTNNAVTSGSQSANHTHSGTTGTISANHTHSYSRILSSGGTWQPNFGPGNYTVSGSGTTGTVSANHTHSITTGNNSVGHTHSVTSDVTVGNPTQGTHTHTITNANEGSDTAHNNMQPYIVLNKIIKY